MDETAWDERYRQAQWVWSAAPNQFAAEALGEREPGYALDLACGEGRNALWLAEKGWRVTGVDFSQVALGKARALAEARGLLVDWVAADVTDYRPERGAYDAVLIAYLHLAPPRLASVLRHAASALAPGGMLVVVGHDAANPAEGVGGPQDPDILYTPEAVAGELAELRVERAERIRRPVEGAPRPALDTLVIATRT